MSSAPRWFQSAIKLASRTRVIIFIKTHEPEFWICKRTSVATNVDFKTFFHRITTYLTTPSYLYIIFFNLDKDVDESSFSNTLVILGFFSANISKYTSFASRILTCIIWIIQEELSNVFSFAKQSLFIVHPTTYAKPKKMSAIKQWSRLWNLPPFS